MTNNKLTDTEFATCEDTIDAMRRRARRSPEQGDAAAIAAWDEVYSLPQKRAVDRAARDAKMIEIAVSLGLVSR
jgi:hypothetical protein